MKLIYLFAGLVAYVDLDERAIDALREFNEEGALTVLQQFKESDLSHVQVNASMDDMVFVFLHCFCSMHIINLFYVALI